MARLSLSSFVVFPAVVTFGRPAARAAARCGEHIRRRAKVGREAAPVLP